MGRQRGLVHLTGQYGDVRLSINDGKGIAKLSVPVAKTRIANDPSYALTRKNNAEFKGASMAVTTLMACFGENALSFADRYLYSRLLKSAMKVLKLGPGLNG